MQVCAFGGGAQELATCGKTTCVMCYVQVCYVYDGLLRVCTTSVCLLRVWPGQTLVFVTPSVGIGHAHGRGWPTQAIAAVTAGRFPVTRPIIGRLLVIGRFLVLFGHLFFAAFAGGLWARVWLEAGFGSGVALPLGLGINLYTTLALTLPHIPNANTNC